MPLTFKISKFKQIPPEEQIKNILERIEKEGLKYPLQVLPSFVMRSAREIVYDPADLVEALWRGIDASPVDEVAVQEAFVMEE